MKIPHRPLSPHLQVYNLPLTALLSISHRITGVSLTLGVTLLTLWVFSAALGEEEYNLFSLVLNFWLGKLVLFGFSVALFYHLCNGIRHLFWDIGMNFDLRKTMLADFAVLFSSIILTTLVWLVALMDLI
ncbi:MAG: succinate dehydrogenase, cytochrome b556 subunit [Alphaproteobacteria bacterium TMED87]|nr:succinate dehydrogenase, cytochrome b556 subunit [Rhodospirillaceae bacterium]OUV07601.1 MAG: succinate dehydrogenase, cytochrome b556 subunit [Alphaproteobacteria bacterium TMED87]|tara:strand:- start:235 stop:624 length:390 start_codon:yes stop_codon:yes gene_type:complete